MPHLHDVCAIVLDMTLNEATCFSCCAEARMERSKAREAQEGFKARRHEWAGQLEQIRLGHTKEMVAQREQLEAQKRELQVRGRGRPGV